MYDVGDLLVWSVRLYDADGELVDAPTVALQVTAPDGTVLAPTVANPPAATGCYQHELVATMVGRWVGRWLLTLSTGVSAAHVETMDVLDASRAAVSLADAKQHLNKSAGRTGDDEELRPMVLAAGERVAEHLGVDELVAPVTAMQRLAVLEVLGELWERSQRAAYGTAARGGYGTAGTGGDEARRLPLRERLTDLLGPPVKRRGAPLGCFPPPEPWPESGRPQ